MLVLPLCLVASLATAASAEPTSLQQAARDGDPEAVRGILAGGGDVDARDAHGRTALQYAADGGHDAVVRLLVGAGADVNAAGSGDTPLLSALSRSPETARFLIEHGADVRRGNEFGSTPLHVAVQRGWRDGVVLLIDRGAEVNARTGDGDTPLLLATASGDSRLVELLLQRGAEVDARNARLETPLMRAAGGAAGDLAGVTRVLLDHGAAIDAADSRGWAALQHAVSAQHGDVVALLLARGAKVDLRDDRGQQPLHVAAQRGGKAVAVLLLDHGVTVGARDNDGNTPLHAAARRGDVPTITLLLERGADPLATAKDGGTALDRALLERQHDAAVLLRERQLAALDKAGVAPARRTPVVDTDRMYKSVVFVDARRGYAFGTGYLRGESAVVGTEDGGATWRLVMDFPRDQPADDRLPEIDKQRDDIWAVSVLDRDHLWVRTLGRRLHRTTDGGRTFEVFSPDLVDPFSGEHITSWVDFSMQFVSPSVGYAVAAANVFRTADGGRSWTARSVPRALGTVTQLWFFDEQNGIAVTGRGFQGIVRTTDGGKTWTGVANAPSFDKLSCTRAGVCAGLGLRANGGSFVMVSDDRGQTWRDTRLALAQGADDWEGERPTNLQAVAPNRVVLVGYVENGKRRGLLLSWNGASWSRQSYDEPRQIDAVDFLDASSAWFVAHDSSKRLYRTADGGKTLSYVPDYFNAVAAQAQR